MVFLKGHLDISRIFSNVLRPSQDSMLWNCRDEIQSQVSTTTKTDNDYCLKDSSQQIVQKQIVQKQIIINVFGLNLGIVARYTKMLDFILYQNN